MLTLEEILDYDRQHGLESDAYAFLDQDLRHVPQAVRGHSYIGISAMSGDFENDLPFYIAPREARCLAAQLLREADRVEAIVTGRMKWPADENDEPPAPPESDPASGE